jgi:predicted DNA-binding protein
LYRNPSRHDGSSSGDVTKNTPVNPPPTPHPRHVRYSVRHQARLDPETSAKLEELASTCHRKRSAILRFVMQWGLRHSEGWTIDRSPVVAVPQVPVLLEPERLQQVQAAAAAHGASLAAWLREAVRRVTAEAFPVSWRASTSSVRSHESGYYHRKFGLRLDNVTSQKLETLTETFERPAAEVIRQLILQARVEDFPQSWQLAVAERQQAVQPVGRAR